MLYEIITPQPLIDVSARAALLWRLRIEDDGSTLLVTKLKGRVVDVWLTHGRGFLVLQSCGLILAPDERFETTPDHIANYVAQVNAHPGGAAQLVQENVRLQKSGLSLIQCDDTKTVGPYLAGDDAAALLAASESFSAAPGG